MLQSKDTDKQLETPITKQPVKPREETVACRRFLHKEKAPTVAGVMALGVSEERARYLVHGTSYVAPTGKRVPECTRVSWALDENDNPMLEADPLDPDVLVDVQLHAEKGAKDGVRLLTKAEVRAEVDKRAAKLEARAV